MRTLVLLLTLLAVTPAARAQSYQDKKDANAIGVIERSLAKLDRVPALFDGTTIPAGADLAKVEVLLDQLKEALRTAASGFADLSAKAAQRADIQQLQNKFDDLTQYRAALFPAFRRATAAAAADAQRRQHEENVANEASHRTYQAFYDEVFPDS